MIRKSVKKIGISIAILTFGMLIGSSFSKLGAVQTAMPKSEDKQEKARKEAYQSILENLYSNRILDEEDYSFEADSCDISKNQFAIYDIDSDGREELIIQYTQTQAKAGMTTIIYDFDENLGKVYKQLSEFPSLTFYNNGIIEAKWSNNQGYSGDKLWPYTLYRYDKTTDTYIQVAWVDAWDRSISEKGDNDLSFPEQADTDKDGIVYYIMKEEKYSLKEPVDAKEYNEWRNSYLGESQKVNIPFLNLTQENINIGEKNEKETIK